MTAYAALPIVGAFFRPPAQSLLNSLAVGTPLFLLAEPENPHDVNAIAVWLETQHLPESSREALTESLPNYGFDLDTIIGQDQWHLGYLPKLFAKRIRDAAIVEPNIPMDVTFAVNPQGQPRVAFKEPIEC